MACEPIVMIVEDHTPLRRAWARSIRRRGCDALEAGTIEEGRAAVDVHVDAWIVDQRLPDGLGTDLVRDLRRAGSKVPVLLVAGRPSVKLANEAASLLAFFSGKPVDRRAIDVLLDAARHPLQLDARIARELELSDGEHEVVARRLEGVSRAALAPSLHVTEDAVKSRIRNILKKAMRRGWAYDDLDALLLDYQCRSGRRPAGRVGRDPERW